MINWICKQQILFYYIGNISIGIFFISLPKLILRCITMISSGMVRKIDLLGRIVIPKEMRKNLNIDSGDDIEMYIDKGCIILKKFQTIETFDTLAKSYCNTIYNTLCIKCFICSKEKIIASSHKMPNEQISPALLEIIKKGESVLLEGDKIINLINDSQISCKSQSISPIVSMGNVYGAIVAYSGEKALDQKECNFIYNASVLLCGQMT